MCLQQKCEGQGISSALMSFLGGGVDAVVRGMVPKRNKLKQAQDISTKMQKYFGPNWDINPMALPSGFWSTRCNIP